MNKYNQEFNKLNSQQKIAVTSIDGPVLVVAGPGTGKTQLLSMRVANIIRSTDTDPDNILCLTFTNKAALNMRERILNLTDTQGKNVMVKTFHSFAAEIMNMYPQYFWNGAKLSTASESIINDILLSVLNELPLDDPLAIKFAGQFTANSDIKVALKLVKEAGLTPEKLEAIINLNLVYIDAIEPMLVDILSAPLSYKNLDNLKKSINNLPSQGIDNELAPLQSLSNTIKSGLNFAQLKDAGTNKTKNTGKWKQSILQTVNGVKGVHKERKINNWWLSLSKVYKLYRQQLHERGYYDYSDMIVEVITVLEQNPEIRAEVQEKFLYILIDEFQDSNAAQMRLAHLIAEHHSNLGKPNLMVVGDDDQSIYKFNGAELANMLSFKQNYPTAKLIVLTDNYRSSQDILNVSNEVIMQAKDRLTLRDPSINKKLTAKNYPKQKSDIQHLIYQNQAHQNYDIARLVSKLSKNDDHSIAILARNNNSLKAIASELINLKVPINFSEQNNILEHPLFMNIYDIVCLLTAIREGDIPSSNYQLSMILRHPMWGLSPQVLWELAINAKKTSWLSFMSASKDEKLKDISTWLFEINSQIQTQPLRVILEIILGLRVLDKFKSPIKQWYIQNPTTSSDYLSGISAVSLLLNLVNDYSKLSSGKFDDFAKFIKIAVESNQVIPNEISSDYGKKSVHLLSIHKAKGLEFHTVFVIDTLETNWQPRTQNRRSPMNLPLQPAFDDQDDYVRLMYVALTRAKQNIYLSSYKLDGKNQDVLASSIITEIFPKIVAPNPTKSISIKIIENSIEWPKIDTQQEHNILKPKLDNFSLSVTALLDFLDVSNGGPETFKENILLRLPFAQSNQMAFGTAMHSALELAQIQRNKNTLKIPDILNHYTKILSNQFLPQIDHQRYLDHGLQLLKKLLANESFYLPKNSLPEQAITDVTLNKVRLFGKLDRIDFLNNQLIVVDYKTGKPLTSFFTKDKSKEIKAWRHRTQLIFYCMLIKNSSRFKKYADLSGKMIYLEAKEAKELVRELAPTNEQIEYLQNLTERVWQKITQFDFPDTSSYEPTIKGISKFEQDLLNRTC